MRAPLRLLWCLLHDSRTDGDAIVHGKMCRGLWYRPKGTLLWDSGGQREGLGALQRSLGERLNELPVKLLRRVLLQDGDQLHGLLIGGL